MAEKHPNLETHSKGIITRHNQKHVHHIHLTIQTIVGFI